MKKRTLGGTMTNRTFWIACLMSGTMLTVACGGDDSVSPQTEAGTDATTEAAVGDASDDAPDTSIEPQIVGQIDHVGRPALKFAVIPRPAPDGGPSREDFDHMDVFFGVPEPYLALFQQEFVGLDNSDGTDDWNGGPPTGIDIDVPNDGGPPPDAGEDADAGPPPDAGFHKEHIYPHPLAGLMTQDYIVVDPNMPFSPSGYLDIEVASKVNGDPFSYTTCGGRWPGDDVVDKFMSLAIKKSLTGVSDGVNQATKAPTMTFPYLASPN